MSFFPAPRRSLSAAVLGSVVLHAVLLYAAWPRPPVASQSKVHVIEARLLMAAAAEPVSAPAVQNLPTPVATPPPVESPSEPSPPMPTRDAPALSVPASPAPQLERRPAVEPATPQVTTPTPPQVVAPAPPPAPAAPPTLPAPVPLPVPAPAPVSAAAASATSVAAYLPASELDPPPRPLTDIPLVYPAGAGMRMGEVVLDLLIGSSGVVEDVKVVEATPPGLFEASAITAFVSTRFAPGMRAGVPSPARMRVAVQYSASGMVVSGPGAPLQPPAAR